MKLRLPFLALGLLALTGGVLANTGRLPEEFGGDSPLTANQPEPLSQGLPEIRLTAGNYQEHGFFGYAVDLDGSHLVAGAPGTNLAGQNAGGVYVFEQRAQNWSETALLVPDRLAANERLGMAVALNEDTIAAGAPYATTRDGGFAAGAVYVFVRRGGNWVEQARLTARDGGPFDLFGSAVALDGDTLVVGALSADGSRKERNTGAVYVYHRENEIWVEQARLSAPDGGADDFFGRSLAVHEELVAVGAFGYDAPETGPNAGAVYFFRRRGAAWFFEEQFTSTEPAPKAQFGFSMELLGNAAEPTWLVVGANQYAPEPVDPRYASPPGRVELFRRQAQSWQPITRLSAEVLDEREAGMLGAAVAIGELERGNFLLVAGSLPDPKLYLFQGDEEDWEQTLVIQPELFSLSFGKAVAIGGSYLAAGSPWTDINPSDIARFKYATAAGVVYLYDLGELKPGVP